MQLQSREIDYSHFRRCFDDVRYYLKRDCDRAAKSVCTRIFIAIETHTDVVCIRTWMNRLLSIGSWSNNQTHTHITIKSKHWQKQTIPIEFNFTQAFTSFGCEFTLSNVWFALALPASIHSTLDRFGIEISTQYSANLFGEAKICIRIQRPTKNSMHFQFTMDRMVLGRRICASMHALNSLAESGCGPM